LVEILLNRNAGEDEHFDVEHIIDCYNAQDSVNKLEWVKKIVQLPGYIKMEIFENLQIADVTDAGKIVRVAAARYDNTKEIEKIEEEKKDVVENGPRGSIRRKTAMLQTRRRTGILSTLPNSNKPLTPLAESSELSALNEDETRYTSSKNMQGLNFHPLPPN
jgi:hypothetical protein